MLTLFAGMALQIAVAGATGLPPHVSTAVKAVEAGDASAIDQQYSLIKEVGDASSSTVDGHKIVTLLSGCQQGDVRTLRPGTYVVDYRCVARQQVAVGCDSGDMFLILAIDDGSPTLALAHRRRISTDCPVSVPPPPPPPVDEVVARAFVQALIAEDQATIEKMVTDRSFVATVQRFPGSKDVKEIGNAKGLAELRKQFAFLTGLLGKPKAVTCRKETLFEFCKFDLKRPDVVLIAFVNTTGSGIYMVRFDYVIRGG